MFTGIIETIGTIRHITKKEKVWDVSVAVTSDFLSGVKTGDSIAVNGVCLTVVAYTRDEFTVQVVQETRDASTWALQREGYKVNLEKALSARGRFDGHIVQGHVDGRATLTKIERAGESYCLRFSCDTGVCSGIIPKGSVALDGVSLTVQSCSDNDFSVAIIPHTYAVTTLSLKKKGDMVNLETDVIGKYVASYLRRLGTKTPASPITLSRLMEQGF